MTLAAIHAYALADTDRRTMTLRITAEDGQTYEFILTEADSAIFSTGTQRAVSMLRRTEREHAVLRKPQPVGVSVDGWDV